MGAIGVPSVAPPVAGLAGVAAAVKVSPVSVPPQTPLSLAAANVETAGAGAGTGAAGLPFTSAGG